MLGKQAKKALLMNYKLSKRSLDELKGVDENLQKVVKEAIKNTTVDFGVLDGKRTAAEQKKLYDKGASKLDGKKKKSKHQTGEAVDLVPYVGTYRWEWPLIYPMARAVWYAAKKLDVHLRWGGVWDKPFLELDPENLEHEVYLYSRRHAGPDFLDGPHFELWSSALLD